MDLLALPRAEGFSEVIDGKPVGLYPIYASDGACCCFITNYGARIVSLFVPDKAGALVDVVLGYNSLKDYMLNPGDYMGAVVGRCAGRIAAGLFVLDGMTYVLPTNDNHNTLNGGAGGLHTKIWTVLKAAPDMLVLTYTSEDGEEGFPGRVEIEIIYEWTENTSLKISYHATTDKATLVNLSSNIFFNLSGEGTPGILDHELCVNANTMICLDSRSVPTGKLDPVNDTAFDFRSGSAIGSMITNNDEQLQKTGGYDHHFVLTGNSPALSLRSPSSGIHLALTTNQPAVGFSSGNKLNGTTPGKSGLPYAYRSGVTLVPQGFPDAIHHPQFPSVILRPGDVYRSSSEYHFST